MVRAGIWAESYSKVNGPHKLFKSTEGDTMKTGMAVALAAVLALAGCAKATEEPLPTPDGRAAFVRYAQEYTTASDKAILKFGDSVCQDFDRGMLPKDIFQSYVLEKGMDASLAGNLAGAAVRFICPEHKDMFNEPPV